MKKSKLNIILFGFILVCLPIITLVMPKKEFSQNENRMLAEYPELTVADWLNKSFKDNFEIYISDHFLAREKWIIAKNKFEIVLGKTEIKEVLTVDNQMVEAWKQFDDTVLNKNISLINDFGMTHQNLNVYTMIVPTTQGIYTDILPENAGLLNQKEFIVKCYESLSNVKTINVYDTLFKNKDKYIYYRTDHHWTSYGAYLAYVDYCCTRGLTPYMEMDFNVEHVSDEFRGTLYSKTLDSSVKADVIDFYKLKSGEPDITLKVYGQNEVKEGLYYEKFLKEKDKYSAFLGTNKGLIYIESSVRSEDSLLVIKDSFSHCLIPFLTKHYKNIAVLDLRYANKKMIEEIDTRKYSDVLFIYNATTFSENNGFQLLTYLK